MLIEWTLQTIEKRRLYRPIEEMDLQEETYNKYYLTKFTRETLRSANPYAVVKIDEVIGERPEVVTGHNNTSRTMKITKQRASGGYEQRILKGVMCACETGSHLKYNHTN